MGIMVYKLWYVKSPQKVALITLCTDEIIFYLVKVHSKRHFIYCGKKCKAKNLEENFGHNGIQSLYPGAAIKSFVDIGLQSSSL
jgi:hypothetical protein